MHRKPAAVQTACLQLSYGISMLAQGHCIQQCRGLLLFAAHSQHATVHKFGSIRVVIYIMHTKGHSTTTCRAHIHQKDCRWCSSHHTEPAHVPVCFFHSIGYGKLSHATVTSCRVTGYERRGLIEAHCVNLLSGYVTQSSTHKPKQDAPASNLYHSPTAASCQVLGSRYTTDELST